MLKPDQKSIATRFSAAAGTYNRHSSIQSQAASFLLKLLVPAHEVSAILEIGCGTGILTKRLVKKYPAAAICATDISEAMTASARKQLGGNRHIQWLTGDFNELEIPCKVDLAVSSSSLHWITPLELTFRKIAGILKDGGTFAFSIMVKGTLGELHNTRKKAAPDKPVSRQLPTQKQVMDLLRLAGFRTVRKRLETSRAVFRSTASLLKSLHEQGVTSGSLASSGRLLNRRELVSLVSSYDNHYKSRRGGVFATYKILYVVASVSKQRANIAIL